MENLIDSQRTKHVFYQKETFIVFEINNNTSSAKIQNSANFEKKFVCEKCNKLFSTTGNLRNHIKSIHYNYRPFKCSFPNCTKKYPCESKLKIHERTHTGIRPFICEICQKSFNEKRNLKEHLKSHSEIRPFKCPLCDKGFKCIESLKEHIKYSHYKIKNFSCQFCNKKFGKLCVLKNHMFVHTKEKKLKREVEGCGKCLEENSNMLKHYACHFKNSNEKTKRTYGPKKINEEFEEKVRNALSQLDNKNIGEIKLKGKKEFESKIDIIIPIEKQEIEHKMDIIIPIEKNEIKNKLDITIPIEKKETENKIETNNINSINNKEISNKLCINSINKKVADNKLDINDENKYNYLSNFYNISNSNLANLFYFTNFFPSMFNCNNNLIDMSKKNENIDLKSEKIKNDNNYDINNIYKSNINK